MALQLAETVTADETVTATETVTEQSGIKIKPWFTFHSCSQSKIEEMLSKQCLTTSFMEFFMNYSTDN